MSTSPASLNVQETSAECSEAEVSESNSGYGSNVENNTSIIPSPSSSPCVDSEQLSPCVIESIEKVKSLKKEYSENIKKIEENNVKESPSLSGNIIDSAAEETCSPDSLSGIATAEKEESNVSVSKNLFMKDRSMSSKESCKSRLYAPTRSTSAKRISSTREEENRNDKTSKTSKPRCSSAGVRKRPTRAVSPKFRERRPRANEVKYSSEELQYQQLEKEKKEAELQMKKFQKTFQVLKSKGSIPTTVRSTKELTVPMTPHFPTDNSKRKRVFAEEHKVEAKKSTEKTVRSGPTIPEPFHFAASRRSSTHSEGEKPVENVRTSGELIQYFNSHTRSSDVPKRVSCGVTQPTAPKFRTEQRSHSVGRPKPLSRDEIEEKEMEEARAKAFKAKPVNKKIFESMGVSGVPKVPVKAPTVATEFHLSCNERAAYHDAQKSAKSLDSSEVKEESSLFKARAMPDFSKPEKPRVVKPKKLTEAHSPKLSGGERASSAPARRQRPSHEEVSRKKEEEANAWKQKLKERLELTTPVDLHLRSSDRGSIAQKTLQERIQRQLLAEKEAAQVHATPFNEKIFKEAFKVAPSKKELTEFLEFKFSEHPKSMKAAMEEMEKSLKEASIFHARPLPSSTFEVKFKTKPSDKEPVTPLEFKLQSDQRSVQRKSFDEAFAKSKEKEEEMKAQELLARQDKENFELNKLRRTPVSKGGFCFKATKVLQKDPYPVKQVASTPLTEPTSPGLRTALRTRHRDNNQ